MPKQRPLPPVNYDNWRKYILERDKFICQDCGKIGSNTHHIKSYIKFPDLRLKISNGTTLCNKCHKLRHAKKDKI